MKRTLALVTGSALLCVSMTGCFFNEKKAYTDYVQGMLDCTYFNIQDKYMELTDATTEEAQELYDSMTDSVAAMLCEYCMVDYDLISDETYWDYLELAGRVLEKASYTVAPAEKAGSVYHITVTCEPMDFLDIIYDPVSEVMEDYEEDYAAIDSFDYENDPEYLALEEDYARDILDALYSCVNDIGYYEAQNIIVEILDDGDYYSVSDNTWNEIDKTLLGLNT